MESSFCRQKKLFETEKTGEVSAGAGDFVLDPALGAALLAVPAAAVVVVVEEPFSVRSQALSCSQAYIFL